MIHTKKVILGILLSVFLAMSVEVFATQTTYIFYPTADTFIKHNAKNENEGLATNLRIQHPVHYGHVLLKFSQANILNTIGSNHVVSANLKLYIETNFNNWGSGTIVDVHRLNSEWEERITTNPAQGVTWNCYPIDTNLGNGVPNCEEEWDGGYYEDYISASLLHQNNLTGWISYNVTSDVQLYLNGIEHFGWLIRKRDPSANGSVDYTSIQGTASFKPRLEVTVDTATTCTPTEIDSVSPGSIVSNGISNTITVKGTGLNNVYGVLRNNSSISFTIVDSNTLTFNLSSSTTETHTIQLNSNCLTSPIDQYTIEAGPDIALHQPLDPPGIVCPGVPGVTQFSLGYPTGSDTQRKYLCYKGSEPVRLIGNTVPSLVTDDSAFPNNGANPTCMNENEYTCGSSSPDTQTRLFVENARYLNQHGSNLMRVWVFGHTGRYGFGKTESMPFKKNATTDKYTIKGTDNKPPLDPRYRRRLIQVLKEANANGQVVMLSLFEHGAFRDTQSYQESCWFPGNSGNNDLGTACQLPTSGDAAVEFYDICDEDVNGGVCGDLELSCLGRAQKNLVDRIMNIVKTGNTGKPFKKVIIELGNETSQFGANWTVDPDVYKTWHKTVAQWVRKSGQFVVAINPGPEKYSGNASQKYLFDCNSTCTNQYEIVKDSRIHVLSLHADAWSDHPEGSLLEFDPCKIAQRALSNFSKPVIINDDGIVASAERNNNNTVKSWANQTSVTCSGLDKGVSHFEHLEDGSQPDPAPVLCTPASETQYIDCDSYNKLGDISGLSNLCSIVSSSCPALSATQYCVAVQCY